MIVGIDEAGRGPVCGPLVYGIAWMPQEVYQTKVLERIGVNDSKALTAEAREGIYAKLADMPRENFGFDTAIVQPAQISRAMLAPRKVSLNLLSFEAARGLLYELYQVHSIKHVYIDLVSPEAQYAAYIRELMPDVPLTICAKADATYPITGAASIVAKVTRDRYIQKEWGSGYPSDPSTKMYLAGACDRLYGFPNHVRHSWQTVQTIYSTPERCITCDFAAGNPIQDLGDTAAPSVFASLGLIRKK